MILLQIWERFFFFNLFIYFYSSSPEKEARQGDLQETQGKTPQAKDNREGGSSTPDLQDAASWSCTYQGLLMTKQDSSK